MGAAEKLPEGDGHDKVTEKRMAELVGTTAKALQRKRERKIIPIGVWSKIDGRIMYSKRRYDEWIESLWTCQQGLNLLVGQSEFVSPGTRSGAVKRSPSLKPRKESLRRQAFVLR